MSIDARRCLMLLCLPLLLSACGDPSRDWEAGGLYSVWEGETDFGVVKVLAVDPEAISVAWYGPTFPSRPTSASSAELAAGAGEDAALGFDHLPLPWRDFELMYPIRIGSEEVTDAELENYRIWRETGAEPVSFEDLAMMNAELEELPDQPSTETADPLEALGGGGSADD